MENIEDRLRKASMTGSIHELQDDSVSALMSDPPIFEDSKREEEEEEIFEDAQDEFVEPKVEVSPVKPQPEQVNFFNRPFLWTQCCSVIEKFTNTILETEKKSVVKA